MQGRVRLLVCLGLCVLACSSPRSDGGPSGDVDGGGSGGRGNPGNGGAIGTDTSIDTPATGGAPDAEMMVDVRDPNCPAGEHTCEGACVSNLKVEHCGAACVPCPGIEGGQPVCNGTKCDVMCPAGQKPCGPKCIDMMAPCDGACKEGFNACNNTCVAATDKTACGPSCQQCPTSPFGKTDCDGTQCSLTCNPGYHKCGDQCVADNSPNSCGTSCTPCMKAKDGDAECRAGKCELTCPTAPNTVLCAATGTCLPVGTPCGGSCSTGTTLCKGVCTPTASIPKEDCFNGEDDDCDNTADCADPDCQPTTQCVPDPGAFAVGVQLGSAGASCPTSFGSALTLRSPGTSSGSCNASNCRCNGRTECHPFEVAGYYCGPMMDNEDYDAYMARCQLQCQNSRSSLGYTTYTIGGPAYSNPNCSELNPSQEGGYDPWAFALTGGGFKSRTCSASGSASLPALSGGRQSTVCSASRRSSAGCTGGQICIPRPSGSSVCAYRAGDHACPSGWGSRDDEWYTSVTDNRRCSSCSCGEATGGSCPREAVFGSEESCGVDGRNSNRSLNVSLGQTKCAPDINFHNPNIRTLGSSSPPSCGTPSSTLSGSVSGSGQHTVCCL